SFTLALPDLAVTTATAPSRAVEGTSVPVTWTVQNVGANPSAATTWNDAVYLSTKTVLDGTAIRLLTQASPTPPPLGPTGSYSRNVQVPIPGNVATGSYNLLFVADDNGAQAEADAANDTNDVLTQPIILAAPDLQVTTVSGPQNGFTGQSVLVSWTDQNNG